MPLHVRAAHGGLGRLAGAPQPKVVPRKRDGGNDGSALDTATVAAAPRLSYGSVTNENWRKSIRNKSLEFTGFHYQRLKAVSAFSAETIDPFSTSVGDRSDLWHAPLIRQLCRDYFIYIFGELVASNWHFLREFFPLTCGESFWITRAYFGKARAVPP